MASSAPDHLRTPGLISNRPCYEGIKVIYTQRQTDLFLKELLERPTLRIGALYHFTNDPAKYDSLVKTRFEEVPAI